MEAQTSYHGNRLMFFSVIILTLSICTAVSTYRLRKSVELTRWKKAMSVYDLQLDEENRLAINGTEKK